MRRAQIRSLERWEAGTLSSDALAAEHPDTAPLIALHEHLSTLADQPLAAPALDRAALEAMLPPRADEVRAQRARRPIAVALVAALLGACGAAYAAEVEPVRSAVGAVVERIGGLFGGGRAPEPPRPEQRAPTSTTIETLSGADASTPGDPERRGAGSDDEPRGSHDEPSEDDHDDVEDDERDAPSDDEDESDEEDDDEPDGDE